MRATDRQAVRPACLLDGSWMSREVHVRFCERATVQSRRPTQPGVRRGSNSLRVAPYVLVVWALIENQRIISLISNLC